MFYTGESGTLEGCYGEVIEAEDGIRDNER